MTVPFAIAFSRRLLAAGALVLFAGTPAAAQNTPVPETRPVIVIDDVVLGNATQEESELLFAAIRPAIASVEVMKGAAAVERFGSRAEHGAILIRLRPEAADAAMVIAERTEAATSRTEPLMVVDGVIMANTMTRSQLNPSEIDRVEVIRGEAAAALYGARAANGVVIITTKRDIIR